MTSRLYFSRRKFITLAGMGASGLVLAGCDSFSEPDTVAHNFLDQVENLTEAAQRLLITDQTMAREYDEADISPNFRANGSISVQTTEYRNISFAGFRDYRLEVSGLVQQPLSLSLDEIRALPSRTQITRHDCVEGWSCIGKWTGPQLATVLAMAGLQPEARYVVFRCFDELNHSRLGRVEYYESIGMQDALHPQTILAHEMNDRNLSIPHGAPLRLRVERQLGYKSAKFIRSIEVVSSFADIRGGKGGYYEDGNSYEWYAGI
jgi:DMSO/TMAO reductase YedYZ molybdopterin-dependent catalytic subunit